jgi:ribosomal protein S18 acetylase RimI-like enzyme
MTGKDEFLALAEATGSFHGDEIEILKEVLGSFRSDPDKDYSLIENRIEGRLAGFAVYGRTPMTEYSWDVYWIAVDPSFQRRGIGRELLEATERAALRDADRAILRVETSGTEAYAGVRRFYDAAGYYRAGTIKDFYAPGDDFCLYAKDMRRNGS